MAPSESWREQVVRQLGEIGNIHAAVAAVPLPELLGLEVFAVRRGDHRAADKILDVSAGSHPFALPARGWRRARIGIFAVDAGDTPPQSCELFLDILHSPFLCPLYRKQSVS